MNYAEIMQMRVYGPPKVQKRNEKRTIADRSMYLASTGKPFVVGETNCPLDLYAQNGIVLEWRRFAYRGFWHVAGTTRLSAPSFDLWQGDESDDAYGNPEGTPGDILWQDLRWGDLIVGIDTDDAQQETLEIWYARRRYTEGKYSHLHDEMVERAMVRSRQEAHDEYFTKSNYDYAEVYYAN